MKRTLSILLAALLVLGLFTVASAEGEKRVIVVDGGGDQQNFNSTKSMEKSDANPYPYNELELLIEEYNKLHTDVEVQLLPTSKTTDRDALVALMTAGEAPDIIYQNMGVYKNTDIGTDWFVPTPTKRAMSAGPTCSTRCGWRLPVPPTATTISAPSTPPPSA